MTNKKMYSMIIAAVAVGFIFSMTASVIGAELVNLTGKINQEGKLVVDDGSEYWLYGADAPEIEKEVGKRVEIKGLMRDRRGTGSLGSHYRGPAIEVYSYEWVGTKEKGMK